MQKTKELITQTPIKSKAWVNSDSLEG